MATLVKRLSMIVGRPVVDQTGFDGEFDLAVDFTPDETTIGLVGSGGPRDPGGFAPPSPDPNRPPLLIALQEQLGLKLVSARNPVEILIIDHVERPGAN